MFCASIYSIAALLHMHMKYPLSNTQAPAKTRAFTPSRHRHYIYIYTHTEEPFYLFQIYSIFAKDITQTHTSL